MRIFRVFGKGEAVSAASPGAPSPSTSLPSMPSAAQVQDDKGVALPPVIVPEVCPVIKPVAPDLAYLDHAIELKSQKVTENYGAFITEALSDAPTAIAFVYSAQQAIIGLTLAPFTGGILPVIMMCAAVPAVLSLVSEIQKDNKDLRILKKIRSKYEETGDESILEGTRLFVRMHGPKSGVASHGGHGAISPVRLNYHDMNAAIREMIEEKESMVHFSRESLKALMSRQALYSVKEKAKFTLSTVFNAFSLSVKACTVQRRETWGSTKRGLKEVWALATRDRSHALSNMFAATMYESYLHVKAKGDEQILKAMNGREGLGSDAASHLRKLHTLQLDIRNNSQQRFVTAGGTLASVAFVSLALIHGGLSLMTGRYVEAASHIGLSALLAVPAMRVLSDRLSELSENERDQDVQVAARLAKLGL